MASENYIIRQIEDIAAGKYSKWQIGLTDKPLNCKAQFGSPLTWLHWKADSEQEAKNAGRFFLDRGMYSADETTTAGVYVYILNLK